MLAQDMLNMAGISPVDRLGDDKVAFIELSGGEQGNPVLVIKVLGNGGAGGAGHFHKPGVGTGRQQGGMELFVYFGQIIKTRGIVELFAHAGHNGPEGIRVLRGP